MLTTLQRDHPSSLPSPPHLHPNLNGFASQHWVRHEDQPQPTWLRASAITSYFLLKETTSHNILDETARQQNAAVASKLGTLLKRGALRAL